MTYDELTTGEKNKVRDVMNSLLVHTFIPSAIYSRQLKVFVPNDEYALADKYFEVIKETMARLGFSTLQDTMINVIYISDFPAGARARMDKDTTMLLLVLYQIKSEGDREAQTATTGQVRSITIKALGERMLALGLWKKLPNMLVLSRNLRQLVRYRFIDQDGPLSDINTTLFILDTVNLILTREKVAYLLTAFSDRETFLSETVLSEDERAEEEESLQGDDE